MSGLKIVMQERRLSNGTKVCLLRLSEAIDAKSVVQLQDNLNNYWKVHNYNYFILNMSDIQYVNSTGMGTLVNIAEEFQRRGGSLVMADIQPKVKVIFEVLGLQSYFNAFSSEADCLKFLEEKLRGPSSSPMKSMRRKRVTPSNTASPPRVRKTAMNRKPGYKVYGSGIRRVSVPKEPILVAEEVSEAEVNAEIAVSEVATKTLSEETLLASHKENADNGAAADMRKLKQEVANLRRELSNINCKLDIMHKKLEQVSAYWGPLGKALQAFSNSWQQQSPP